MSQYWHFQSINTKQYYTHFSEFISRNKVSRSYYKLVLHIFGEFISNNIDTYRFTTKEFYNTTFKQRWNFEKATGKYYTHFPQKLYQTILLSLSLRYELVLNLYELRYVQRVPLEQFLISKSSSKNRPFHVKWTKAGHNYLRFWWKFLKGRYEIRLSWKFQHKLITCSKMITPQSWLDNLKIDRIRGGSCSMGAFLSLNTFFST